jgi:hypothetical protein
MPFMTTPSVVKIKEARGLFGRATWQLTSPLMYCADDGTVYAVPAGFETDFASVPRLPLAYFLAGDTAHMSAVLHDYLCRELFAAGEMTGRRAAELFREAMRSEGVPGWRRELMYYAVLLAGGCGRVRCKE